MTDLEQTLTAKVKKLNAEIESLTILRQLDEAHLRFQTETIRSLESRVSKQSKMIARLQQREYLDSKPYNQMEFAL